MKTLISLLILFCSITMLQSQNMTDSLNIRPLNNFNLNLSGDASFISINYERIFFFSPTFLMSSGVGLGYNEEIKMCFDFFGTSSCPPPQSCLTIPHHITGNIGKGRGFLEFGLGGTFFAGSTSNSYVLYPIIGYRFLPLRSNKMSFRFYFEYPITESDLWLNNDVFFIPIGFSLGISF